MHSSPWSCITVGCWRLGWPCSRYCTLDSWFRWSGLEWLENRSVVTWDKAEYQLPHFPNQYDTFIPLLVLMFFLHFLSTSGSFLTHTSISPFFLHPCIPVIPPTVPPVPPCLPICTIFSPIFTLYLSLSHPNRRYEVYPVCADLQGQILACYKENVGKTLNCSNIAALYLQCVNNSKQVCTYLGYISCIYIET